MPNNGNERTIIEVRQALKQACQHLSPNSSRIDGAWSRLLNRYEPCRRHASSLIVLHPLHRIRDLSAASPQAYREGCERQGGELAHLGVPPECSAAAVGLFVECCLPYFTEDGREAKWRRALLRWAPVYQFFLLTGYSQAESEERRSLAEKAELAERRSQEFSAKLGDAYEKERRRLAQDLHDEIGHDLIVLKLYTQVIALDLKKGDIAQVRRKLRQSVSLIKHALAGVRHLVFDLGPAIWNEQGFVPAVRMYVRQYAVRTGIQVRFSAQRLKVELPARYETALYKVLQGALANVAAHADARQVRISMASTRDRFQLKIEDDGRGFNPRQKLKAAPSSYGLRAMRDRIELLAGTIDFHSRPARRNEARRPGTTIEVHLPLDQPGNA
jgi:signal transduction histidine kinase